jgi:hypothetical protein
MTKPITTDLTNKSSSHDVTDRTTKRGWMSPVSTLIVLFLTGDVMTGRGIDQILPHPSDPVLYEPSMKSAKEHVKLAEQATGAISTPVDFAYIWGDALEELQHVAPDARIINLETAVTRSRRSAVLPRRRPSPRGLVPTTMTSAGQRRAAAINSTNGLPVRTSVMTRSEDNSGFVVSVLSSVWSFCTNSSWSAWDCGFGHRTYR